MEWTQLEAFLEIVRTRSFRRAAANIHLSQPSITARIQSLEESLGVKLFERQGRGVKLTASGEGLLPFAERLFAIRREAEQTLASLQGSSTGKLALGSTPTVATYTLPSTLDRFLERHPGVRLAVTTGHLNSLIPLLLDDLLDACFLKSPVSRQGIANMRLDSVDSVLVSHCNNPLTRRESLDFNDIAEFPIIRFSRASELWHLVERLYALHAKAPKVFLDVDNAEMAKAILCKDRRSLAVLPRVAVEQEVRRGNLVELPLRATGYPIARPTFFVYKDRKQASPWLAAFRNLLRELYPPDGRPYRRTSSITPQASRAPEFPAGSVR